MRVQLLMLTMLLVFSVSAWAEVKIIAVKHRPASELEAQVQQILDEGEKIKAASNHLVLIAEGESLLAAEKMIALLDVPLQSLLIRVRHVENSQQAGTDTTAQVHYGTDAAEQTVIRSTVRRGNSSNVAEQALQLVEGGRGLIEVGQQIPFTEQWSAMTGEITGYAEKIAYQTIATGFWVSPVKIIDNNVLLDIEPYISNADNQGMGAAPKINFSQLRSRLQVPFGRWYPLGSQLQRHNTLSRAIISWRTGDRQADQELEIRIDPVE